jgi:hypothetical protein
MFQAFLQIECELNSTLSTTAEFKWVFLRNILIFTFPNFYFTLSFNIQLDYWTKRRSHSGYVSVDLACSSHLFFNAH